MSADEKSLTADASLTHVLSTHGAWSALRCEDDYGDQLLDAEHRYLIPLGRLQPGHFYLEQQYELGEAGIGVRTSTCILCDAVAGGSERCAADVLPKQRIKCVSRALNNAASSAAQSLVRLVESSAGLRVKCVRVVLLVVSRGGSGGEDKTYSVRLHHVRELEYDKTRTALEDGSLSSASLCRRSVASMVSDCAGPTRLAPCAGDFCEYVEEEELQFEEEKPGSVCNEVAKARARYRRESALPSPHTGSPLPSNGEAGAEDYSDRSAPFSLRNSREDYRRDFEDRTASRPTAACRVPYRSVAAARSEMGRVALGEDCHWPTRVVGWWSRVGKSFVPVAAPSVIPYSSSRLGQQEAEEEGTGVSAGALVRHYSSVRVCVRCYHVYRELDARRRHAAEQGRGDRKDVAVDAAAAAAQRMRMERLTNKKVPVADAAPSAERGPARSQEPRGALLRPLPWQLGEEGARLAYEGSGSRFVASIATRAREEAALAGQYNRLLNVDARAGAGSLGADYLDLVREQNWPVKKTEGGARRRPLRAVKPPRAYREPDVDRLLHPWQRELRRMVNGGDPTGEGDVGDRKTMGRRGARESLSDVYARSGPGDDPRTYDAASMASGIESSELSLSSLEHDDSSIGWSPFVVPSSS